MNLKSPISEIMTKDVIVLGASDSLAEAERVFGNHSLRHAPVVHKGELVGMLSVVDLRRSLEFDDNINERRLAKVNQVMTSDPVSVQVGATIGEVGRLFTEDDFHAIPVLDGSRVVGIISTTDIINYLMESLASDLD
ncbi:MAG: CBS domain-containing protein [Saprospiraceae bacterium]|nr:CBS domain-containing protein [Saprospiraceae bacterium]